MTSYDQRSRCVRSDMPQHDIVVGDQDAHGALPLERHHAPHQHGASRVRVARRVRGTSSALLPAQLFDLVRGGLRPAFDEVGDAAFGRVRGATNVIGIPPATLSRSVASSFGYSARNSVTS